MLHSPLCAPPALLERFSFIDNEDRRYVSAMVAYLDEVVGRVVTSLKTAKMWDQTVFVWQSDNGAAIELTTGAKSAYPLRGGYYTNWEGGIRAPGFINGGYLIKALEQEQLKLGLSGEEQQTQPVTTTRRFSGLLHIADWYATFCGLAGVDPTDSTAAKAGLPPIDSIDMWPALTNPHNLSYSPRVEIFASGFNDSTTGGGGSRGGDTALISGHYKLILGRITQASWCGKVYPNNSMHWDTWATVLQCPVTATTIGCLFNIYADPTEHVNLAATPEGVVIAKRMYARLLELQKGVYSPDRGKMQTKEACASAAERGGFWGPWMSKA
jgi:arylsulfatase I/J